MKICYLGDASSIHVRKWAEYFARKEYEVTVITDVPGEISGVQVINIGNCLPSFQVMILSVTIQILKKVQAIRKILKEILPDIFHAHYATNYGFLAALTCYKPLVQSVHGSDIMVDINKSFENRFFVRYALQRADLITSVAPHITKKLKCIGISERNIVNLQYGIDIKKFSPLDERNRNLGKTVISNRYLIPKYRVDVLIDAIPLVLNKIPDIKFVIAGNGELKNKFIKIIKVLGLENQVEFLGNISNNNMPDILRTADIYISTSPTDGLSLSLLEAMACGLFPVVSDIPANRLLIENNKNGLLFHNLNAKELAENICTAMDNLDKWNSGIKENITTIRKEFNQEVNLGFMGKKYKEVLR